MTLLEERVDTRDEHEVKQVIVIRRDLRMRRGKEIAQGAHAAMAFLTNAVYRGERLEDLPEAQQKWIAGMFTKVTCRVDTEEQLLHVYKTAVFHGVEAHIIKDSGRTEFGGVPTYTAVAIGPDWCERVDRVTGELRLY